MLPRCFSIVLFITLHPSLSFSLERFYRYVADSSPLSWPATRRWWTAVLITCHSPPARTVLAQEGRGQNNDYEYRVQYLLVWATRDHAWVYNSILNLIFVIVGKRSWIWFLPQLWPLQQHWGDSNSGNSRSTRNFNRAHSSPSPPEEQFHKFL